MTSKWPTVACRREHAVRIWHSRPRAGNPDLHAHDLTVAFCWKHEINPNFGHTWELDETDGKVAKLCDLVRDQNLNDLLPLEPTIETLACWLLVRAPAFYDAIEIDGYGGYRVRVERSWIPAEWRTKYLGADATVSLTA